jgi:hypothetical protein
MEIGAVHGLVGSTLRLLESEGVTHLGAAFDTVIRSFRNDIFPGYKTEEGVPAELLAQFPHAEDALEAIGVTVWRMTYYEADDALASAAARFGASVDQVVLLSPDKDLAQCVRGGSIVTYDRKRGAFVDEAGVWQRFGVAPESSPTIWPSWATRQTDCPAWPGGERSRPRWSLPSIDTSKGYHSRRTCGNPGFAAPPTWRPLCGRGWTRPSCTGSWRPCGGTSRSRRT